MNGNWLIWSLLSAVFAGATAVLAKIGVTEINSNLATAIRTTVILIFAWVVASATTPLNFSGISGQTWMFLALSGIATGLSWLCYFRALQVGEASRVAPIDKLSVIFAILFAALVLGEKLTIRKAVGGALIAGGAVILAL